jgi:hypothetical protein
MEDIVKHKLSILSVLFVGFFVMSTLAWGQQSTAPRGIRGYLDPQTGVFHTLPAAQPADDDADRTVTVVGGKFVVNFTITVDSTIASTTKIGCNVEATLADSTNFITEQAGTAVTRGSATTVACSVTIPYSWKLSTASTDEVSLTYTITSPTEISTATLEYPLRISTQSIATIKVPANGATTTEAVAATI